MESLCRWQGVLSILFLATASQGQTSNINLRGLWDYAEGTTVLIAQQGDQVDARFVSIGPNSDAEKRGFEIGDLSFYGSFESGILRAKVSFHYYKADRQKCPEQWSRLTYMTLIPSNGGNILSGSFSRDQLVRATCTIIPGPTGPFLIRRIAGNPPPTSKLFEFGDEFSSQEKPSRLWLLSERPSVMRGELFNVTVGLSGSTLPRVIADRDYHVRLQADHGEFISKDLVIRKDTGTANIAVRALGAGMLTLEASSDQEIQAVDHKLPSCVVGGSIDHFELQNLQQILPANPTLPARVVVAFVDDAGRFVTGGPGDKSLGWHHEGVGSWRMSTLRGQAIGEVAWIPDGQCGLTAELTSAREGKENLTVKFMKQTEYRSFKFYSQLTAGIVAFVAAISALGSFVRTAQRLAIAGSKAESEHRKPIDLLAEYGTGAIGAVALYLAYYFGLVRLFIVFPSGWGIAVLVGISGGYLGATAIDRVSKIVLQGGQRPPDELQDLV